MTAPIPLNGSEPQNGSGKPADLTEVVSHLRRLRRKAMRNVAEGRAVCAATKKETGSRIFRVLKRAVESINEDGDHPQPEPPE